MKAVAIENPGPEGRLVLTQRPRPTPNPGDVLIRVRTAGINRADLMQCRGHYPPPPGCSDLPGLEVAGTVVDRGEGVEWPELGDQVCALLPGGGYAEYCVADSGLCLPSPKGLALEAAAALPEALWTVWDNLFQRARLSAGETLLIQGGTSGIGALAIAIASAHEVTVIATAGTDEKCRVLSQWGAKAINYRTENLVSQVFTLTDHQGVDVILDLVGGPYLDAHLKILKTEGRLVVIAVQGGYRSEINLLPILSRRLTLTGSTLRQRSPEDKRQLAADVRHHLWPLVESGRVIPVIDHIYPAEEAAPALERLEASRHVGKILLRFEDSPIPELDSEASGLPPKP